jgi:CubicO group peptidase (beta-lactamase class C family)
MPKPAPPLGSLVPLPPQPAGVPWPTAAWPTADPQAATAGRMSALLDEITGDTSRFGTTYAVAVVQGGMLLAERYGGELEHWDRANELVRPTTELLSWSMAKSILHAAVGVLVGEGRLAIDMPAPVPEWTDPADPRHAIALDDLLTMRDGLDFAEDYEDIEGSDVIRMLFGDARSDMAHFAADHLLAHEPGSVFNYSSGTSLIVSGIVGRAVGAGAGYERFLRDRLFGPLGMRSTHARLDGAGTFVGSSFVYATAQDYLRFGLLYLRDGVWDGRRLLPEGWVDHGRRARSRDEEGDRWHGAHWWSVGDDLGTFTANGYEGQSLMICPSLDLLVVRLGKSPDDTHDPELRAWRARMVEAFRAGS